MSDAGEVDEAALEFISCADWYVECLEAVFQRKRVTGLAEAGAGYQSAREKLMDALGVEDTDG
jgi:hypothetical protein